MLAKRDVFHEGVWCIADIGTPKYTELFNKSQATVPWAAQQYYGHKMIYFCIVVIFLFVVKRFINVFVDNSSKLTDNKSNFAKKIYYKISAFNRYFSYRRFPSIVCDLFCLPSSFGNFLIIMAGCLYILCYTFIPKFWYRECAGFGSPPLAVRAGLESTAFVPLIFILSGKTNVISQITGISYEKINVYHRWISTACCFLGWVHTLPFYIQAVREGGGARLAWSEKNTSLFVSGIPPLIFLTILSVFSHPYIRQIWYEAFIQIHWICALGFYISLFYHAYPSMDGWKYLVATVVFWITQLCWRAVSKAMLKPNKGFLRPNACKIKRFISTSDKDHYFEIIIQNSNDFSWVPGQHVYVRFPGSRILENHPFSIVSNFEPKKNTELKLIIKARGKFGLTRKIFDELIDDEYQNSKVFLDGPYGGCERPCDCFNNIYLLSSGTGISAVLPFLIDCRNKMADKYSLIENIRFDWAIRNSDNIEWIIPELKKFIENSSEFLKANKIRINIYVKDDINFSNNEALSQLFTDSDNSSDEKLEQGTEHALDKGNNEIISTDMKLPFINLINNKLSTADVMKEIKETLNDRNIFIISGSDSMKVSISNEVASLQKEVFKNPNVNEVYLHSESFGW